MSKHTTSCHHCGHAIPYDFRGLAGAYVGCPGCGRWFWLFDGGTAIFRGAVADLTKTAVTGRG